MARHYSLAGAHVMDLGAQAAQLVLRLLQMPLASLLDARLEVQVPLQLSQVADAGLVLCAHT